MIVGSIQTLQRSMSAVTSCFAQHCCASTRGPQRACQQGQRHAASAPRLLHLHQLQHPAPWVCRSSRKERKGSGDGSRGGSDDGTPSSAHRMQDTIKESRQQQLAATDLLAKLLQTDDPAEVAVAYVDSLDEQFFWTANTYLTMAKKEEEGDVVARLEAALKAAFEAKQATLRPEIQLLNRLLAAEGAEQRAQVLSTRESAERLSMNDRYFFGLLSRMVGDVKRQPEGAAGREELLAKLEGIQAEAEALAPAAAATS